MQAFSKKKISLNFGSSVGIILTATFLIIYSVIILNSIARFVFPGYFIYIVAAILCFIAFSQIDFDILAIFSKHFYIISILLLLITLAIGQVTRGSVRWIPLGPVNIQPTELVRPFLLIFFAQFLTNKEVTLKRLLQAVVLFLIPFILIWMQPSLGVAILTTVGFAGTLLASSVSKKLLFVLVGVLVLTLPVVWFFLQPYQRSRVKSLIEPNSDTASSYNSIQSMISVGSGKTSGRGLGEGIQTQLAFLPERHTDFIFASISEELGFVGSLLLMSAEFFILYQLIRILENEKNNGTLATRSFITGVFLAFFLQTFVHIGMNMGMLPITGLPLPLVSAGGSSLVATMTTLGILVSINKNSRKLVFS